MNSSKDFSSGCIGTLETNFEIVGWKLVMRMSEVSGSERRVEVENRRFLVKVVVLTRRLNAAFQVVIVAQLSASKETFQCRDRVHYWSGSDVR